MRNWMLLERGTSLAEERVPASFSKIFWAIGSFQYAEVALQSPVTLESF